MSDLLHNKVTNVSAGTAVRFTPTPTQIKSMLVHANTDNSGNVFVGGTGVDSTNTPPIAAGATRTFTFKSTELETTTDMATLYMDAASSGDGLTYSAATP